MGQNLNLHQFDFFRSPDEGFHAGEGRGYGPTTFVAQAKTTGEPAGIVDYYPEREDSLVNVAGPSGFPETRSGQTTWLHHKPAEVDELAVAKEHRGKGLGAALGDLALGEHQDRMGHGFAPTPSSDLSGDSSAMLTKMTGQVHEQKWGRGITKDDGYHQTEDQYAESKMQDTADYLQTLTYAAEYDHDTVAEGGRPVRVKPSGRLDAFLGRGGPPKPPAAPSDAPYQRGWTPGQDKLF